jgi:hypothetical protein
MFRPYATYLLVVLTPYSLGFAASPESEKQPAISPPASTASSP